MARTLTLGQAVKSAKKPPRITKYAYWLDRCLKTKAISPEAEAQREHDRVAVAQMRELMAQRREQGMTAFTGANWMRP